MAYEKWVYFGFEERLPRDITGVADYDKENNQSGFSVDC